MMTKELPVGYHRFSKKPFVNYQLNRWWSLGFTRFGEIEEAGRRIRSFADNREVFVELAERAAGEGRLKNAAFYRRAAEFLAAPTDPAKFELYEQFSRAFYEAFAEDGIERHRVPYGGSHLSAMRLAPQQTDGGAAGDGAKGTVVIQGGFDSFIEEFYCFWRAFAEAGYEVIAFDGPGQGASLHRYGVASDHDWEKPVGAVLDYFSRDDVALLGISFGGYWCVRAAAFEKRVTRIVIDPPFYDLLAARGRLVRKMVNWMLRHRGFLNWSIRTRAKVVPTIEHVMNQVLLVNRRLDADPALAAEWLLSMNKHHIHSHLIDQDVLLLGGEKDRFQSPALYELQKAALVNARSLEGRIFTEAEHAANHCQMGNLGLALDYMTDWLDRVSSI
ncbi:MAG: alpha/beta fold hydrolase [Polyangiales bacterium]